MSKSYKLNVIMNNFSNICRICMSRDIELINIYHTDDDMITYISKLNTCIPEIFTADNYIPLPDQICELCCKNLKITFLFRDLCLKSNAILRAYKLKLEGNNFKIDNENDANVDMININESKDILKEEGEPKFISEEYLSVILKTEISDNEFSDDSDVNNSKNSSTCTIDETKCLKQNDTNKQLRHLCSFCGKPFKYRQDMRIHERIHTGIKPYTCAVCQKSFAKSTRLKIHMNTHSKEKQFTCKFCDKKFSQYSNMTVHMKLHTQTERFACHLCEKSFSQKRHLKQHILFHEDERRFTCESCNLNFSMKHHLKRHMMTHTGEKPIKKDLCKSTERKYPCTECEWSFMSKEVLKRHLQMHANGHKLRASLHDKKRRFPCSMCVWSFTKKHHLERHMIKHQENRKFKCKKCSEEFSKNFELQRHYRYSHKNEQLIGIKLC